MNNADEIEGLPNKNFFRVDEVAKYFDVTERTIRLWIEHGHLQAKKIAGTVRIPKESILECGHWFMPKRDISLT